ncbi:MAG: Polyribonucleotide nucleotidyltransferase, partial [Bacteroidota bacterium]
YNNVDLGYKATLGYFAQQANGSVWLEKEGTVILATVTSEKSNEFPGFFPLSVDYREVYSATGKIPGGYFKREGKPTDKEVLISRIIDRALRPLFPERYFDKVSVIITAYSIDKKALPIELSLIGTSLALMISDIPFMGPVGCIEVLKIQNNWHFNPSHDLLMATKTRIIVAGNYDGINMVEGYSEGLTEEQLVDIFFSAHEKIKKQIDWQLEVAHDYVPEYLEFIDGVVKPIIGNFGKKILNYVQKDDKQLAETIENWFLLAQDYLTLDRVRSLFISNKINRQEIRLNLENQFLLIYKDKISEDGISHSIILHAFNEALKYLIMYDIADGKKRIDGRDFDSIREIDCLTGILPFSHGSGVFTRGRTQLLVTTTLGGADDVLKIDAVLEEPVIPFMLHYNFLPFSVGEARSLKHPGRREIGHGFLAYNALKAVLPINDSFPYSIRLVADVLECDGSSSMATICGGTMSLLDAGVPLKDMVAGIAMGIIQDRESNFYCLTDIAGIEDELGLMDFKIAGTENFITAIQMDIKHKGGLKKDLFTIIFEKAKKARLHILKKMQLAINKPKEMSPLIPRCVLLQIAKEKIGAVIGSGGKVIKEITEKTNTQINIEDSGIVKIFGTPGENFDKAIFWIKMIAGQIVTGDECEGIIKKIAEFGYFVEIAPNCDGLVHISSLPRVDQGNLKSLYSEGARIKVSILDYDSSNNRIRLRIIK